jgi:hypothetical protein
LPALWIDNVAIVPAFYELIPDRTEYDPTLNFSLSDYMSQNGYEFSQICPKFHKFSKFQENPCDAIWVRSKISHIFNFAPIQAAGWRYSLLDIPFLAVIFNNSIEVPSVHPFGCIEEDLMAGLEFYEITNSEQRLCIANVFWKLLLTRPGISTFIDAVLGDNYDGYASVSMGRDFVCGY